MMHTQVLYRYLFTELTQQAEAAIPELFAKIKKAHKFRGVLRTLNALQFEEALYGNSSDELESYEIPLEANWDWAEEFERYNSKYQLLKKNDELIENFKKVYYAIMVTDEIITDSYYSLFQRHLRDAAYNTMAYFGASNVEETLEHFDKYREKNKLGEHKTSKLFTLELRHQKPLKDITAWQCVISENYSPEAISFFQLANEIEEVLGKSPKTFSEAKDAFYSLPSTQEWNRETLNLIYTTTTTAQDQLRFISSVTDVNLHTLVNDSYTFANLLKITKSDNVKSLLNRLGAEYIRSILKDNYGIQQQLEVMSDADRTFFLTHCIGLEELTKSILTPSKFSMFIEYQLPKDYNKNDLLFMFSKEQLSSYVSGELSRVYINTLVSFINNNNRLNFLLNKIGKDLVAPTIDSAYILSEYLDKLPPNHRMPFIKEMLTPEQLKLMRQEQRHWRDVKAKLINQGDRDVLNTYMYSGEELVAKATIKNIKAEIRLTKWQFGMFESPTRAHNGSVTYVVPEAVSEQIDTIWKAKRGDKTHADAVVEIKRIGSENCGAEKGLLSTARHWFHGKTPNEIYFEKFSSDEAFNQAFVNKK